MIEFIVAQFEGITEQAVEYYGVNPATFLVLYLLHVPFSSYSLFRIMRALAKKLAKEIVLWSTVFLCALAVPFGYVLFFGRNLPWWVYGIIALLIGQGIYSLLRKIRSAKGADPSIP